MAEKILKTRIQLRYDTLTNWTTNNPVLKAGEIAIATIPTAAPANKQLPPVMFKVGDGEKTFTQLDWASALAADVYSWAKAAARPAYKYGDSDLTGFGSAATKDESYFDKSGSASTAESNAKAYTDSKIKALPAQAEYTLEAGETDGSLVLMKNGVAVGDPAVVAGWADLLAKAEKGISDAAAAKAVADAKYTKPTGGIPKTDLASAVQASLGKADTALQAHQTIATGTASGTIAVAGKDVAVKGLGTAAYEAKTAFATAAQGTKADNALPKTDFETFKGTNTTAIADAKKAGTDAAAALETYKTANDAKVSKNATDISNLQTAVKAGITFKGKVDALPAVTNYSNGDLIIVGTKEYILYDNGTAKSWIELGDEGSHLTKATADGYYVPLTRTVAGVDLKDNVTKAELQTALNVADGATKVVESTVSGWGFTKNKGTVTGIKMNDAAKTVAADGTVDLGTVITAHQDISGKQDKLSTTQLAAANSGITAAKVEKYDGYESTINGKQAALTTAQVNAVNSGITSTKVTTYDGYASKITALEGKAGLNKVGTVTSVSAGTGLKVTGTSTVAPKVEIDEDITFVFNCGGSSSN